MWLYADVLVKFLSMVLIKKLLICLHKNKSVKQIPTKYQCLFNKMVPCIHPLKYLLLNTRKLRNNTWLNQSNPGMNGNDKFSPKAGLVHINWSVCVKCKCFQSQHLEIFHVILWLFLIFTLKIPVGEKKNPKTYNYPLTS